jgi:recombinational DNA repair ATPase RecF
VHNKLQVLLLDEITVGLDVVTRIDLLDFFKEEREKVIQFNTSIPVPGASAPKRVKVLPMMKMQRSSLLFSSNLESYNLLY